MADDAIKGLRPEGFWRQFAAISAIPRCSTHEERIREHVLAFAAKRGLESRVDAAGNMVVRKPAHPSRKGRPTVVIQGHLDMVCEKNQGTEHDFAVEGIRLVRDGEWLRAQGTTLGADNGIAVAAALAILDDRTLVHGPLEALFTVDEESGLIGATKMDPGLVTGRVLLNIDSEDEGIFYIGCAGGQNAEGWIPVEWQAAPEGVGVTIALRGLRGGHSGTEIHEGRGNALVLGSRLLRRAAESLRLGFYEMAGGGLHNAIPRELFARAVVQQSEVPALMKLVGEFEAAFRAELGEIEPRLSLTAETNSDRREKTLTPLSARRLLDALHALPNGVTAMSRKIEGLVESSTNVAAVHLEGDEAHILTSQRSTYGSARDDLADRVSSIVRLAGGRSKFWGVYPSWPPEPDSDLVRTCVELYRKTTGKEPRITAIHAGLECGVIGEKVPGIRMISFGPDIHGAHTPEERVNIASLERVYSFLLETLATL